MTTTNPTPAPTPEQRAQWLHDHNAPKDWIVFTESEVAELKQELAAKDREIERLKAHDHFVQKQQVEPAIARAKEAYTNRSFELLNMTARAEKAEMRVKELENKYERH